jgi:anti-anti-sigma factor
MHIAQCEEGRITVVSPREKLDTGTAPMAGQTLTTLVEQGARRIVVDFTEVTYVSSAGLRILLATAKQLRGLGGELRVCALNEAVQEVFEISGFNTLLPVFASTADAIRKF